jgi:hypothetical protein
MTGHSDIQLMFYEYLRDELAPSDRATVETHLSSCKECTDEFKALNETLSLFPAPTRMPSEERTEEFWHSFASSIIAKATARKRITKNPFAEVVDWIEEILLLRPRYAYAVGASITVALASLAFWTFITPTQRELSDDRQHGKPLGHVSQLATYGETIDEQSGIPVQRVNQYFRKSKTLLVGLANMKMNNAEPLDFSTERRVSRDLVREARYLKRQPLDVRSRHLMNDLERILIELENIEEQNDLSNVEIIRGGIHQENLLFKIRMAEAMYDSAQFMYASERR